MNDNLSNMINDQTPQEENSVFNETELNVRESEQPQEETKASEQQEAAEENVVEEEGIPEEIVNITSLVDWFNIHHENFSEINYVRGSIRGVDQNKYVIVTIPDGTGETNSEGHERRLLKVFENADVYPVIDKEAFAMMPYNNGTFEIRYAASYANNVVFKCYGVKTGLIVVACQVIDDMLIPYNIQRIKKRDVTAAIPAIEPNYDEMKDKLKADLDKDNFQILYKQSSKVIDELNKTEDAVRWLLARQNEMYDINHLLQIDNVLINLIR